MMKKFLIVLFGSVLAGMFGAYITTASAYDIQGLLYQDTNNNGRYDSCEFPISEYVIEAIRCSDNQVVATSATIQNGASCGDNLSCLRGWDPNSFVNGLAAGNYKLRFTPMGGNYATAGYPTKTTECLNGNTSFGQVGVMGSADPYPGHNSFIAQCQNQCNYNGVQDNGESGVDCSGGNCPACVQKHDVWQCTAKGWNKVEDKTCSADNWNGNASSYPDGAKVCTNKNLAGESANQCKPIQVGCTEFVINGNRIPRNTYTRNNLGQTQRTDAYWNADKITLTVDQAKNLNVICDGGVVGGPTMSTQQSVKFQQLVAGTTYQWANNDQTIRESDDCWKNFNCGNGQDSSTLRSFYLNNPAIAVRRSNIASVANNQLLVFPLTDWLYDGRINHTYNLYSGSMYVGPRISSKEFSVDNIFRTAIEGRDWRWRYIDPAFGTGFYNVECSTYYWNVGTSKDNEQYDSCGSRLIEIVDTISTADVSIIKKVDKKSFINVTGELITWTLTYANAGSIAATGVTIKDVLPNGLEFVSASINPVVVNPNLLVGAPCSSTGPNWHCRSHLSWNIGTLQPGQTGQITLVSRYATSVPNDTPLINYTQISTSTIETDYTNNDSDDKTSPSIVPVGLVSCEDSVITQTATSTGALISYQCAHVGGTTGRFEIYSGSTLAKTVNGFNGSVSVPYGVYTTQCVIDNTVTYKVTKYTFATVQACPYKKHTTTNVICAVQANLTPSTTTPLNPSLIVGLLNPIPYCNDTQLVDTNYQCQSTVTGDTIYVRDDAACTKSVVVGGNAQLGDRVRFDANYNGIQDAGESGIAGATMKLYTCTNTLVATGVTNAAGMYLFTGLFANQYKVIFDLPSGYDKFTYKNTTGTIYTGANDSNVGGTVGTTDCIPLAYNESNLTIDAGVYKGTSCCGGNNLCGNGKLEPSGKDTIVGTADDEECDDGNVVSGDKCSRTCKIETPSCTRCGGGSGNTTKKITKNETGGYLDPPNVMVGEYLPYRWNFDKASDIEFTDDCNIGTHDPSVTYVVNSRDNRGAICEFYLVDGKGTKSKKINHYCDERRNLTDWKLFQTYFNGVSSTILKNYNGSSGASFIAPSNWTTSAGGQFDYLGEYNLVWDKTTYYTCEPKFVESTTWDTDARGVEIPGTRTTKEVFVRYELSNEWVSEMDIKMPFTVTKPYMTQQNGLSASTGDADIMNKILKIDGTPIIRTNPTSTIGTLYRGSSNLTYLVDTFVKKYTELAKPMGTNTSVPGLLVASLKKVSNAEIYIVGGNDPKIIDSAATLGKKTIIVPNGDITVIGDINNNILLIVPKGNIILKPDSNGDSYSSPRNQSLKGIYISKKIVSDPYWNNELTKSWIFGGQLKIDGLIVNRGEDINAIKDLTSARRSTLKDWFNNTVSRIKLVQEGSSLQITTSPSLWTNLPPGANELMKELQAFK